jgi:DNA-binding MarR family transcriptional regulator
MKDAKPLTPREIRLWSAWLAFSEAVASNVGRDVAEATGLSAADHRILECLVEHGEGRLRQRELAQAIGWDKSRISHQLTRMQERGLLTRSKTAEHGSRVAISAVGRDLLESARPVHANAVRRHLIGRLTPAQISAILAIGQTANEKSPG